MALTCNIAINRRSNGHPLIRMLLFGLAVPMAGCGPSQLEYTEVKRINEKVTAAELNQFLRIIESLPDKKLPPMPTVYAPLPQWKPSRTLPVNELLNEEQESLDQRWSVEWIARQMKRNRPLQRALRRENITREQFLGLTLAIGVSLSRSRLRVHQNLAEVISRGENNLRVLRQDPRYERTFSKLRREGQHSILRSAGWVTRIDRARRLKEVPPENIALVKKHFDELKRIFPKYFVENPLDAVADLLEEHGVPFEELNGVSDADITWVPGPEEAFIGIDRPDPEEDSGKRRAER